MFAIDYEKKENKTKSEWHTQRRSTTTTHLSHMLAMTPQYASGTPNHSQSPGPMFMLMEQKLLFSWWPGVLEPGTCNTGIK